MFTKLLATRRFAPIFWCQFFAALNDNFVKTALSLLAIHQIGGTHGQVISLLAGVALVAPFFILSALGGEIADRFDKASVAGNLKLAEIPIACLAAAGSDSAAALGGVGSPPTIASSSAAAVSRCTRYGRWPQSSW